MNKRELVNKIRREFPELKFKTARHNVEGWDHYVIILDDKYVFRFPREADYKDQLYHETKLLEYLQDKVKLSIPKYKFIARDRSFAGYEMLPGVQMTKERFAKVPKPSRNIIAKQTADFLTTLHKTPLKEINEFRIPKAHPQKLYKELADDTRKHVYPRVSSRDELLVEEYLKEFKQYLKFPNSVLTHNDFNHSHILLDQNKNKLSGVIDFTDRHIDDPAIDFAELWLYGKDFVQEVYENYKGPKDKDFLKRSVMYYKRLPLVIMAAPALKLRGKFNNGYKIFKEIFN